MLQHTGTPLRGGKKVQFNMFLKQIENIEITQNFTSPILFPAIWVDEGIALNDENIQLLEDSLISQLRMVNIVHYTLLGVGAFVFILFSVIYVCKII